jgi:hypothetical protein
MASTIRPALKTQQSWKNLQEFFDKNGKSINMLDMFKADPERFKKFSIR